MGALLEGLDSLDLLMSKHCWKSDSATRLGMLTLPASDMLDAAAEEISQASPFGGVHRQMRRGECGRRILIAS